ncbi:MAG TPA: hypothetical protein VFK65_01475 [Candidatus Binatia bacterium]|nr:hypothetical protein [Candidatus Binatia bacterium]
MSSTARKPAAKKNRLDGSSRLMANTSAKNFAWNYFATTLIVLE